MVQLASTFFLILSFSLLKQTCKPLEIQRYIQNTGLYIFPKDALLNKLQLFKMNLHNVKKLYLTFFLRLADFLLTLVCLIFETKVN